MLRSTLILLVTLIGMKSFSQEPTKPTKAETQDWIKEKIEGFSYPYDNLKGYYGTKTFKVSFTECSMTIIMVDANYNSGFKSSLTEEAVIPIKDLSKLNFLDVDSEVISLTFRSKTENAIKLTFSGNPPVDTPPTYVSFVEFRFKKISLKDNLSERLTKAFNNLIELCGGKVTKDVF